MTLPPRTSEALQVSGAPEAPPAPLAPRGAWPQGLEWAVLAALGAAAFFGTLGYRYPDSNHAVTIPFITDILRPELFPGDALVEERTHFFTLFNGLLANLARWTGWSLPLLFHTLYVLALAATLPCVYRLATAMSGRRSVALLATALAIVAVPCLGGVRSIEATLMERTLVLPLQLWGFASLFEGRTKTAFSAVGASFLLHPLSGIYCAAALTGGVLCGPRPRIRNLVSGLLLFILFALPVLWMRLRGTAPSMGLLADPEWLATLRLRSPNHIDVTRWSPWGVALAAVYALATLRLASGLPPHARRPTLGAALAICCLCLAGVALVEGIPVTLAVQLQLFRSYRFLYLLGLVVLLHRITGPRSPAGAPTTIRLRGAVLAFALAAGGVGYLWNGGAWIGNAVAPSFVAVQDWARTQTPEDAVFVVPPDRIGFRIRSERTVYADWKDGTQSFFNPEFAKGWRRRLERLGFDADGEGSIQSRLRQGYGGLTAADLRRIAAEYAPGRPVFAVTAGEAPALDLLLVFKASRYRVFAVRPR